MFVQAGPLAEKKWPFPSVERLGRDEYFERLCHADLIVASAGFGVVSDCAKAGRPLILFPRRASLGEHLNDHQLHFALDLRRLMGIGVAEDVQSLVSEAKRLLDEEWQIERGDGPERTAQALRRFLAGRGLDGAA